MGYPIIGLAFHASGALSSSICYLPQRRIRCWSWQTFWWAQATVCWLILPVAVALLTTPHGLTVLRDVPPRTILMTFALGSCYGVGGTAFGVSIKYIGLSLTYALAIGISCLLGTVLPPMLHGDFLTIFAQRGGDWVMPGLLLALIGIGLTGWAGNIREANALSANSGMSRQVRIGLMFSVLAGVLSALFGIALSTGWQITAASARAGAGRLQGTLVLMVACGGAFMTTSLICAALHSRKHTWREYATCAPSGSVKTLAANLLCALITGVLWYMQFFLYGIAHSTMGKWAFLSWALHMTFLIICSGFVGLLLREWRGAQPRAQRLFTGALAVLLISVVFMTLGAYNAD